MTTELETKDWFTMPLRGRVLEDKLGSLRCIPTPHVKPTFDPTVVIQRYVEAETIKEWDRDGTTIVCGVMNWLLEDPEIPELIEREIHIYMHHRKMIEGHKNFGWLRSGYYTQIQHVNLNVNWYIACGRGERRIQSSFTLNKETDINCTLVIPGFHKQIRN